MEIFMFTGVIWSFFLGRWVAGIMFGKSWESDQNDRMQDVLNDINRTNLPVDKRPRPITVNIIPSREDYFGYIAWMIWAIYASYYWEWW